MKLLFTLEALSSFNELKTSNSYHYDMSSGSSRFASPSNRVYHAHMSIASLENTSPDLLV